MQWIKRIFFYLGGFICIAIAINISKLAGLGISPVSSVPRALEVIWGFTLGKMVILIYCVLVLLQFFVLGKQFKLKNLLGVPAGIVFGYVVDIVGIDPNAIGHLMVNVPKPQNYLMQLVYLAISIIVIAVGVVLYLKPDIVPMPAEGLAQAIAQRTGKTFGDCKTFVDVGLILTALLLQIIFLGGFDSFSSNTVVVREGTILSAVLVGQMVKLIRRLTARQKKGLMIGQK